MRPDGGTTFALAALVLLAGCQSGPLPPTEVRTVTVNVPVATPCVKREQIPAMPAKVGSELNGDAGHDLDVVASSALHLRTALDKALALLGGCVG